MINPDPAFAKRLRTLLLSITTHYDAHYTGRKHYNSSQVLGKFTYTEDGFEAIATAQQVKEDAKKTNHEKLQFAADIQNLLQPLHYIITQRGFGKLGYKTFDIDVLYGKENCLLVVSINGFPLGGRYVGRTPKGLADVFDQTFCFLSMFSFQDNKKWREFQVNAYPVKATRPEDALVLYYATHELQKQNILKTKKIQPGYIQIEERLPENGSRWMEDLLQEALGKNTP